MKKLKALYIVIIIAACIIIASIIIAVVLFTGKTETKAYETVAKSVLTKTYGAALQDYINLTNALTQSSENDDLFYDYLQKKYGEQLTESGYTKFLSSRIPSIATKIAYEENSDLKVSSIELKPQDAIEGGKRFDFTIQVQTEKDASKAFTFKGSISLTQEDGHWKVDGITPH
ncbi:MAG: hypothetical protein QM644_16970 [Mobilitalea sp.]